MNTGRQDRPDETKERCIASDVGRKREVHYIDGR